MRIAELEEQIHTDKEKNVEQKNLRQPVVLPPIDDTLVSLLVAVIIEATKSQIAAYLATPEQIPPALTREQHLAQRSCKVGQLAAIQQWAERALLG